MTLLGRQLERLTVFAFIGRHLGPAAFLQVRWVDMVYLVFPHMDSLSMALLHKLGRSPFIHLRHVFDCGF